MTQDGPANSRGAIAPAALGSPLFQERHRLKYNYVAGAMYKGIASKELVVRMGRAGLLGFLGTGGMELSRVESDLLQIKSELRPGESYGLNFLSSPWRQGLEKATVDLFLKHEVTRAEAAAFTEITPELARFRINGLRPEPDGKVHIPHLILAKVSRPEVAAHFLSPPPVALVHKLLRDGSITTQEAALAGEIPMADDLCLEADSGGHTDRGVAYALLPVMLRMRDQTRARYGYQRQVCVGAAGGLGTPEAIAASFIMGADFVLTGSVNQCTVEAGISDSVKDMLQEAEVQDTDIVPAGDMFEMGAKVQVFKKGLLFPARAKKLYELYRQYNSLEEIDEKTRTQIETRYFKRSFEDVYAETKSYYRAVMPEVIERAERDPKHKMALIFRWYFVHSHRLAFRGDLNERVDFQIHCGPALGSFNQWVKGTALEAWRQRHVDAIADLLMQGAARVLQDQLARLQQGSTPLENAKPSLSPRRAVPPALAAAPPNLYGT